MSEFDEAEELKSDQSGENVSLVVNDLGKLDCGRF
jgi:hypothetical protein